MFLFHQLVHHNSVELLDGVKPVLIGYRFLSNKKEGNSVPLVSSSPPCSRYEIDDCHISYLIPICR